MAKRCQISGKTVMSGNNVSHANNRTRRRFLPNLQSTRMHSEILGRAISLRVSTSAMRTVEKHGGLDAYLLQARNARSASACRQVPCALLKNMVVLTLICCRHATPNWRLKPAN